MSEVSSKSETITITIEVKDGHKINTITVEVEQNEEAKEQLDSISDWHFK